METTEFKGFNVRVYALCIENNKVLCVKEPFASKMVVKFPGGGLEFGEGTVACLKREFKEELNLHIETGNCFYIQEEFVKSLAKDQKQLLMLYFKARITDKENLKITDDKIEASFWIDIHGENPFTLSVDQIVFKKLQTEYCTE